MAFAIHYGASSKKWEIGLELTKESNLIKIYVEFRFQNNQFSKWIFTWFSHASEHIMSKAKKTLSCFLYSRTNIIVHEDLVSELLAPRRRIWSARSAPHWACFSLTSGRSSEYSVASCWFAGGRWIPHRHTTSRRPTHCSIQIKSHLQTMFTCMCEFVQTHNLRLAHNITIQLHYDACVRFVQKRLYYYADMLVRFQVLGNRLRICVCLCGGAFVC